MKLSTKGRYGVKAMVELSLHYDKGPLNIRTIAHRTGVSDQYLEQLLGPLRKAGLVKSIRGVQGGYVLAVSPGQITAGQILRTLEGNLAPASCVSLEQDHSCDYAGGCITRLLWERIYHSINEVVDRTTLADMINQYQQSGQSFCDTSCNPHEALREDI